MLPYLTALVPLAPVEHIPQSEASAPKFDIIFEQILFSLHNQQLGILKKTIALRKIREFKPQIKKANEFLNTEV